MSYESYDQWYQCNWLDLHGRCKWIYGTKCNGRAHQKWSYGRTYCSTGRMVSISLCLHSWIMWCEDPRAVNCTAEWCLKSQRTQCSTDAWHVSWWPNCPNHGRQLYDLQPHGMVCICRRFSVCMVPLLEPPPFTGRDRAWVNMQQGQNGILWNQATRPNPARADTQDSYIGALTRFEI